MAEFKSPRIETPVRKGISRAELTVGKTVKGKSPVRGKGKNANVLLGYIILNRQGVWQYQIKGRKMLSVAYRTKRAAAIAMGEKL